MRSRWLAGFVLLTFCVGFAVAQQVAVASHGPRKNLGPAPNQPANGTRIFESNNWAGYAVVGTGFTQARGTWVVPTVDCSVVPNSSASFWVGIDGWEDDTVEQTGTDSDCNDGVPAYYAWYEFAPEGGVTIISVPVSAGDHMSGEIDYDGALFFVTTTNLSTGATSSTSMLFPRAKRASAEWIAEFNGSLLSDFGTVQFGPDFTNSGGNAAADATRSGKISAFGERVQACVMVASPRVDEAVPSLISSDGTSFTVSWWGK